HPANHDDGNTDIKPHQRALRRRFAANISRATGESAAHTTFAKKTVVMPLNQMRFNLPHRIEHYPDDNKQTGAAEKLRGYRWHVQALAQQTRKNGYDRQEDRSCESQTRHGVIEKVRCRFPGPDARNITAVF